MINIDSIENGGEIPIKIIKTGRKQSCKLEYIIGENGSAIVGQHHEDVKGFHYLLPSETEKIVKIPLLEGIKDITEPKTIHLQIVGIEGDNVKPEYNFPMTCKIILNPPETGSAEFDKEVVRVDRSQYNVPIGVTRNSVGYGAKSYVYKIAGTEISGTVEFKKPDEKNLIFINILSLDPEINTFTIDLFEENTGDDTIHSSTKLIVRNDLLLVKKSVINCKFQKISLKQSDLEKDPVLRIPLIRTGYQKESVAVTFNTRDINLTPKKDYVLLTKTAKFKKGQEETFVEFKISPQVVNTANQKDFDVFKKGFIFEIEDLEKKNSGVDCEIGTIYETRVEILPSVNVPKYQFINPVHSVKKTVKNLDHIKKHEVPRPRQYLWFSSVLLNNFVFLVWSRFRPFFNTVQWNTNQPIHLKRLFRFID